MLCIDSPDTFTATDAARRAPQRGQRQFQHGEIELLRQAHRFGEGDEFLRLVRRRGAAAAGTQQRLMMMHGAVGEADHRLEVEAELALADGGAHAAGPRLGVRR